MKKLIFGKQAGRLLLIFQINEGLFNQSEAAQFFERRIRFDAFDLFERQRRAFPAAATVGRDDQKPSRRFFARAAGWDRPKRELMI